MVKREPTKRCVECGSFQVWTRDSRSASTSPPSRMGYLADLGVERYVWRRLHCESCNHRWTTCEITLEEMQAVSAEMVELRRMAIKAGVMWAS
jgi:DNA-directed RNA polymerase subunit N (RpoN/RPB10)